MDPQHQQHQQTELLQRQLQHPQQQQQQQQRGSRWLPNNPKTRAVFLAAAALCLTAAVAVAVAVPVAAAAAARGAASNEAAGGSSNAAARLLGAVARQQAGSSSSGAANEAGSRQLQRQAACNGVPGLCKVPVRLVTFPGTHNSNAIKTNFANLAQHQSLTFAEQLQAGGRLFDLDYAGGRFGVKFGHCMSCLCAFSNDASQNDPVQVFKAMADFLAANPREVIVIGMSNIACGDKAAARKELLGALAGSPLLKHVAVQPIGPNTLLGQLVDSNQRAIFLFYDEWVTPTGYTIGGKAVPNQALWRIYGGSTSVDGQDPATIDRQVSQGLLNDVTNQISQQPPLSPNTPWRIMGLFPSSCLVCRASGVCGPISCADKANSESFILYILGKATSRWSRSRGDQEQLVPAFNGFQIDYLQPTPKANVVTASQKLNAAIAWMYNAQPAAAPKLGLGNCVWVLDDAAAGGLACIDSSSSSSSSSGAVKIQSLLGLSQSTPVAATATAGRRRLQQQQQQQEEGGSSSGRRLLVPANPALSLRILADGKLRKEVRGVAGQVQLLDLSLTATDLQVSWV